MRRKSYVMLSMLAAVVLLIYFITPTESSAQDNSNIHFYVDKDQALEGEVVNIIIWVDSTKYSEAKIVIFYPANNFSFKGDPARLLSPANNFQAEYKLIATKSGNVNLMLSAELTNIKGFVSKEDAEISNIIIESKKDWYSNIDPGSLLGVVVGAILAFATATMTTIISDARGSKKETQKKNEWINSVFTAQLEISRTLISKENESKYEQWYQPLVGQGYISEIEKKYPALGRNIAEIVVDIQEYENKRLAHKIDKIFKLNLLNNMDLLIKTVRNGK